MVKRILVLFLVFFPLLFNFPVYANSAKKYVTLVNPVRGKVFWKSTDSVQRQINVIIENKLAATWLLQYSVLNDPAALELFKDLSKDQELGIFLEIDEKLADDSLVPYLIGEGDWARADKVLLSGYSTSERKRMIDTIFNKFKNIFGFFPTSVGAWYIDTISLDYMVDKYHITALLDVSDQYQTDGYGLWGKPWGTPYYPSRFNSLIPSQTVQNKLGVVKIQWSARDPVLGYGLTVFDSTYSVQANDYIAHHKLDTDYFEILVKDYLLSPNPLAQLTLGLEAGQEGASYLNEFKNQIKVLLKLGKIIDLNFVTMEDFAKRANEFYVDRSLPNFFIGGMDFQNPPRYAYWFSTPFYRVGYLLDGDKLKLRDLRLYNEFYAFLDITDKDKNHVLKRIIPECLVETTRGKERVLFEGVENIEVVRNTNSMEMTVVTKRGGRNVILNQIDEVFLDGQPLFPSSPEINTQQKVANLVTRVLIDSIVNRPSSFFGSWRFSYINKQYYFGWMFTANKLLGFRSAPPFAGIFDFPFQTLVRFRTLPDVDLVSFALKYFATEDNRCTINL